MAINSFTFNGQNSLDYGLYVSGNQTFNSAEKDYSKVSVPGRSGDLLIFNNRYKNVNLNYNAILIDNYEENAANVRAWLLSANGYCRLEDTYHPDEFRIASFSGPIDFDTKMLEAGETTLTFDCKPQRWLKSGEQKMAVITPETDGNLKEATCTIINPTLFDAKPFIRVYGTRKGRIDIGNTYIIINYPDSGTEYIDIDCDIMDCYEGAINRNSNVEIKDGKWPILTPGRNDIKIVSSAIMRIEIIPRWWTL